MRGFRTLASLQPPLSLSLPSLSLPHRRSLPPPVNMASDNHLMSLPPPLFDSKPNPDHNPANQFIPQNPRCRAQQRMVVATLDWFEHLPSHSSSQSP
ncbi:hypothetical protein M0R45_001894 [Rubus argutus]|uniref:Uncharacterized protein n=1 Tax=Rubus argutus TaxID=59490 RepID=A0AAW1VKF7_RUBAR